MPKLSVVIASHNCAAVIGECLAALEAQEGREKAEVIVADSSLDGTEDLVQQRFPGVRLLHFSRPLSVPYLRGEGMAIAQGEAIAILDPYCIVDEGWLAGLLQLHDQRPEVAIGGAVELEQTSHSTLVAWATYFCEYAAFMLPLEEGPALELTGNNIVYKRPVLGEVEGLKKVGFWKTFVNWQLKSEGHQLWATPGLVVKLRKDIPFMEFFRSRYHHGRCFAAMRVATAPRWKRGGRALTAPLLPWLYLERQGWSIWRKGRHRKKFLMAAPMLFLFNSNWAWGELWGYLRGPGESCAQLFY